MSLYGEHHHSSCWRFCGYVWALAGCILCSETELIVLMFKLLSLDFRVNRSEEVADLSCHLGLSAVLGTRV